MRATFGLAALLPLLLLVACAAGSDGPRVVDGDAGPDGGGEATSTPLAELNIALEPVLSGLDQPLYLTGAGDGSGLLLIAEKTGRVLAWDGTERKPSVFLDLSAQVSGGSEQGLLGLAFPPDFSGSGEFWVDYTDTQGDTVLSSFLVRGNEADSASEHVWLRVAQPYPNHNGGMIAFGPDGYLYVGLGDGGSGGDPHGNAQNTGTLLGKILRLDVGAGRADRPDGYAAPATNPFAGSGGRGEIWAYGLRNPWRFSFDRATGDLWIGDVGQNAWEEIDFQAADASGGANYGWNLMEGAHPYPADSAMPEAARLAAPVVEYGRAAGQSVTGGYVYRGSAYPKLVGTYLYADFASGRIWGLRRATDGTAQTRELLDTDALIASFGEDDDGELYVIDLGGTIYRLTAE